MHILLVNDDGPPSNQSSPYVHSLVTKLQAAGHTVSVVLPHMQRSWIGKAHIVGATIRPSYFRPGTVHVDDGSTHTKPLPADSQDEEWVLIDGTPASCVQAGLYHFFHERGPVDLVVSGPNYGRNTTAVFALSSGTLGGALEAAVCGKKAIALSFAFFSRNHDQEIISGACNLSVKLVEHLYAQWDPSVDVYSVNIPLIEQIETRKVYYTEMLQNTWRSGSCFEDIPADEDVNMDAEQHEKDIRQSESRKPNDSGTAVEHSRHQHKHLKWAPKFADVYKTVEESAPGNDGWAVKEGYTSVTPLKASFMNVPKLMGELKLASEESSSRPDINVIVNYEDSYVQPIIESALKKLLPASAYKRLASIEDLEDASAPVVQISSYETIPFEHILQYPKTSWANAYVIRKALVRKHFLANTIYTWLVKNPESILKKHFKPTNEFEIDFADYLEEALVEACELKEAMAKNVEGVSEEREYWILKPGMSDRGEGIRLFSDLDELREIFEKWETENSDDEDEDTDEDEDGDVIPRKTGKEDKAPTITSQLRHFIAQEYIHPPLLLESNQHKFHIRTYVLAVGNMQVYVFREMLALFAARPYSAPWESTGDRELDLFAHLTNTCLQTKNEDIPERSAAHGMEAVQSFWDLPEPARSPNERPKDWKDFVFKQICDITAETFNAASRTHAIHFQPLPNAFEAFGLDFLVDEHMNTWLLEVNAFPDFAQTGPELKERVVGGFWKGVIGTVVVPWWMKLRGEEALETNVSGMHKVLDIDLGRRN